MARLRRCDLASGDAEELRRAAVWQAARIYGLLHGVVSPREDWNGVIRPLTGPCRLRVDGGRLVPTDEPGSDEENATTLAALDDETLLAVIGPLGAGLLEESMRLRQAEGEA